MVAYSNAVGPLMSGRMVSQSILQSLQLGPRATILSFINHGISFQSLTDTSRFEPTIITEYMPKGSLSTLLSILTPTKKYICLLGIVNVMKYLHEQGIIHKDLKLDNILIDQEDLPRICDFGLSRCFPTSLTMSMFFSTNEALRTPLYMAPELLRGDEHFGYSSW